MKLSAMTLGCPAWDLETILRNVKSYGYDGVDFRGLADDLDITKTPAFTTNLDATAKRIQESGLLVSGVSTSIKICDPAARQTNIEEAKRHIPVALGLGTKNLRVFGGGPTDQMARPELAKVARAMMEEILALPDARKLSWNLETHDHWIASSELLMLINEVPDPAFGVLWDMGHTPRMAKEKPADTLAALGSRLRYTHVKDAVFKGVPADGKGDGWEYVYPGAGELPLAESIGLLKKHGYDGWLTFEHEKRWIPELPEPELIFPAFVKWARPLIAK